MFDEFHATGASRTHIYLYPFDRYAKCNDEFSMNRMDQFFYYHAENLDESWSETEDTEGRAILQYSEVQQNNQLEVATTQQQRDRLENDMYSLRNQMTGLFENSTRALINYIRYISTNRSFPAAQQLLESTSASFHRFNTMLLGDVQNNPALSVEQKLQQLITHLFGQRLGRN